MSKKITQKAIKTTLEALGMTPRKYQIQAVYALTRTSRLGMSIPRQNGKTETAIMASIIFALRGDRVIFTVHNGDLMSEVASRLNAVLEPCLELGVMKKITVSVNRNIFLFASCGSIIVKIRSQHGIGVGITADLLICDEAQKMSSDELEAAMPSITVSPRRALFMIGTPPTDDDLENNPASPFLKQRKNSLVNGVYDEHWIEYGIGDYDPTHAPYSLADAHASNPSWRNIPDFTSLIKSEQATLSDEAYARQRLGAWVMPTNETYHEPEFSMQEIKHTLSVRGPSRSTRLLAGVGVYPDSKYAYICYSDGETYEILPAIPCENGDLSSLISTIIQQARVYGIMKIPANSRGNSLKKHQNLAILTKKLNLSSMTETATSLAQFCRGVHDGTIRVFSNDNSMMALGSMWKGYDPRSSAATVEASTPEARSAALALVLASGRNLQEARAKAVSWVA